MAASNWVTYICTRALHSFVSFAHCSTVSIVIHPSVPGPPSHHPTNLTLVYHVQALKVYRLTEVDAISMQRKRELMMTSLTVKRRTRYWRKSLIRQRELNYFCLSICHLSSLIRQGEIQVKMLHSFIDTLL